MRYQYKLLFKLVYLDGILGLTVFLDFSGKDNMLPSGDEARRLWNSLQNCRARYFKDNGHTLLLVCEILCSYAASRIYTPLYLSSLGIIFLIKRVSLHTEEMCIV